MTALLFVFIALIAGAVMCVMQAVRAKGFIESLFWSFISLALSVAGVWWVLQVT